MVTFRQFVRALRELDVERGRPVIAHASLSAFGQVQGGAETVLGALLTVYETLMMPTFTYKTMVTPEVGPADNALNYGDDKHHNRLAEFFHADMPADPMMGAVAEALRKHPLAYRSMHPILSFSGVNAEAILRLQTLDEPLAPIRGLVEEQGWVLLLGVDHTVNTSIHYAEGLANRKRFIRWALTPEGIKECPQFPGCSMGFQALASDLQEVTRRVFVGEGQIQAIPLVHLVQIVRDKIAQDRLALLCDRPDCARCNAVRSDEMAARTQKQESS
jgi:aminoglycoside 3-N-acetyltransferase